MAKVVKKHKINKKDEAQARPIQSKKRYLASFIIGTAVFILIFMLANFLSYLEFQRVTTMQGRTAYGIFEKKLDYNFFEEGVCSQESFRAISNELGFQGAVIDDLEKKLGKTNPQVLFQKKFYTLVELEHLDFVLDYIENCNPDLNTIMFFYSNMPNELETSEDVGKILDSVYSKYEDDVLIYSFDFNLDSETIEKLKKKYNLEESPTVIVNQNVSIINPQNIREIENHLKQ